MGRTIDKMNLKEVEAALSSANMDLDFMRDNSSRYRHYEKDAKYIKEKINRLEKRLKELY